MLDPRTATHTLRHRAQLLAVVVCTVAVAVAGCATAEARATPPVAAACDLQPGTLEPGATLEQAAGEYRLTLVGATSDGAAPSASGALRLAPNEAELLRFTRAGGAVDDTVRVPLYGWAEIDLAAVGAAEIGDVGARDPLRPGVLVLEQQGESEPDSITLRLGSLANQRDRQGAFDGGYTALYVTRVTPSGAFAGTWASGVHGRRIEGHFCAVPA